MTKQGQLRRFERQGMPKAYRFDRFPMMLSFEAASVGLRQFFDEAASSGAIGNWNAPTGNAQAPRRPSYAKLSKCGILVSICELIGPMFWPTLVGAKR
jgi:hypothetical protein